MCTFPLWREDVSAFRAVHGIFQFLVKQTFDRQVLQSEALEAFLDGENSILDSFEPSAEYYIDELQSMFEFWFREWDPASIGDYLSFSSGSTADEDVRNDLRCKVQSLREDDVSPLLAWAIKRDLPAFCEEFGWDSRVGSLEEFNEVRFVPKTALKKRTIGMERPLMNFFQNGLDGSIRHCKSFPRRYLRLDDQTFSQRLAIEGSATGQLATYDFSAASDSISLKLVRKLTDRCDYRLIQWLEATRSGVSRVQTDDGVIEVRLKKFAAMGSVCCFTIESLVFLSIALLACKLAGVEAIVAVYGDDVVLPVAASTWFEEIARALGFHINSDKSFAAGPFREACGVFAFKGVDVTIPSASRKRIDLFRTYPKGEEDFRSFVTATVMANEFYLADLGFARYVCLRHLIDNGVRFLSGQPDYQPRDSIASVPRGERFSRWEVKACQKAPLFVYSDYVGVHTKLQDQWLEQPSDRRSVRKVRLANIVQTWDRETRLPVPRLVYRVTTKEDTFLRGYPTHVGKVIPRERYSDEQRLENWLFRSRFEKREPLHEPEGLDLPFRKPLTAESSYGIVRMSKVAHFSVQ
jgi:hypothetical protein